MEESSQGYGDSNNFLDFLDEQFEANRPYEAHPLVEVADDEYETTTPYWHEVIRDHRTGKPNLPKTASLDLPKMKTNAPRRSDSVNLQSESSGILKCKIKRNKPRSDRCNRLLGTDDLSTVLKQGWTFAKGWDNRPKVSQINPQAVQDDINRMRGRYDRARTPAALGGKKEGSSTMSHTGERLVPNCWPHHPNVVVSRKREKSPGPKYNLQPKMEEQGIPRQLDYFTVKDISFSKSERFPDPKPTSPGVLAYAPSPHNNPAKSAGLNETTAVLRPISPALQLNYNPISFNNSSRALSPNSSTSRGDLAFSPSNLGATSPPASRPGSKQAKLSRTDSFQSSGSPERRRPGSKQASLSRTDSFQTSDSPDRSLSLSRPNSQGQGLSTRVSTSGREFLGSIYYEGYNTPSPGAMYDSNTASRHTSTQLPVANAIFAPTNRGTRTDLRQQAAELRLDPVKSLRIRQGVISVPTTAASKEKALRRRREKALRQARAEEEEYAEVLRFMQQSEV